MLNIGRDIPPTESTRWSPASTSATPAGAAPSWHAAAHRQNRLPVREIIPHRVTLSNYYEVGNADNTISHEDSAWDVAVIGLSNPLGDKTGWYGMHSQQGSGTY